MSDLPDRLPYLLARALEPVLGTGIAVGAVERLPGGASRETFRFVVTKADEDPESLILRRDYPGRPGPPGGMTLESAVLREAYRGGLQVPRVVLQSDDPDVFGTSGMVMEAVEGETIARRILRDSRFSSSRTRLVDDCGRFLAGLHSLDQAAVESLPRWDPLTRCWDEYLASKVVSPTFEYAFRWLSQNRPDPSGPEAIVHGDFRLGNLIVDVQGLASVIDWEGVHLGDPLEDLGWLIVKAWRFGEEPDVAGIGSCEELLDSYLRNGGRKVDWKSLKWWQLFGTLRWGVICLTQASVHLSGAVKSVELAAIGRRVGEQEWDLLSLLNPEKLREYQPAEEMVLPGDDSGLYGIPTSDQLLAAVGEFLREEVIPRLDSRVQFHARVAANVVNIVEREILYSAAHRRNCIQGLARLGVSSLRELGESVRQGHFDDRQEALIHSLVDTVAGALRVSNPSWLG